MPLKALFLVNHASFIPVDEAKVKLLSTQTEESFLKDVSQIPRSQNTQTTGNLITNK